MGRASTADAGIAEIKAAAAGRWPELLAELGGISPDLLDGKHHPCPKCGGKDRFRCFNARAGALVCNQCFNVKNGDGIAALAWLRGKGTGEALSALREALEIEEPKGRKPRQGKKRVSLEIRPWNEKLLGPWSKAKGISTAAARAAGGEIAAWGKTMVVAWPIRAGEKTQGHAMQLLGGRPFVVDGQEQKCRLTRGSLTGWLGTVDRLEHAELVWKVEGLSDCLALVERAPEGVAVLSNPFGAGENPIPAHVTSLAGKDVLVVGDCDEAGHKGAETWAAHLAKEAKRVRIVDLAGDNGYDLRDYFAGGGTYDTLLELAEVAEPVTPCQEETTEESLRRANDPAALAETFLKRSPCPWLCYHGTMYRWAAGRWIAESKDEFRGTVNRWLKAEQERLHRADTSESRGEHCPTLTQNLTTNVIALIGSHCQLPDAVPFNARIALPGEAGVVTDWRGPVEWVSLENGILRLDCLISLTREDTDPGGDVQALEDHRPEFFSVVKLPFSYQSTARVEDTTHFQSFLELNLGGDQERIDVLAEWAGYLMIPSTGMQRFLMLSGEGANGKSVYCAIVEALLGPENVSHAGFESFGERFALFPTLGKLANIVEEVGEVDKAAEGVLKAFTSGGALQFDRKGLAPVQARPTARLMLATNNPPRVNDKTQGVMRRLLLMPFDFTVPRDRRIEGMDKPEFWIEGPARGEMPAILNWALEGLMRLKIQGDFSHCQAAADALGQYRADNNPCLDFFEERVEVWPDGGQVGTGELYKAYTEWAKANGYHALAQRSFGKEVLRAFPKAEKRYLGERGNREYCYVGITLRVLY